MLFSILSSASTAMAGNLALYWGQNSAGATGVGAQQSLASYCANSPGDIYMLSFLTSFGGNNPLAMNIVGYYDFISGTQLLNAPQLGADIAQCQAMGKKVLLSMGGAVGSYGFTSNNDAEQVAEQLWNHFGGGSSDQRPFGNAKIDGFDLDLEAHTGSEYNAAFVAKLRQLYAQDASKQYFVSAAPQCPFPDASVGAAVAGSDLDFLFVQFYNNYCGLTGSWFNYDTWQNFASTASPNRNVKIYVGLAGSPSAAGSGYATIDQVKSHYDEIKNAPNFGGFMVWDASQANSNLVNGVSYAQQLQNLLSNGQSPAQSTTQSTAQPTTQSTSSAESSASSTKEWVPQASSTSSSAEQWVPQTSGESSKSVSKDTIVWTPQTSSTSQAATTPAATGNQWAQPTSSVKLPLFNTTQSTTTVNEIPASHSHAAGSTVWIAPNVYVTNQQTFTVTTCTSSPVNDAAATSSTPNGANGANGANTAAPAGAKSTVWIAPNVYVTDLKTYTVSTSCTTGPGAAATSVSPAANDAVTTTTAPGVTKNGALITSASASVESANPVVETVWKTYTTYIGGVPTTVTSSAVVPVTTAVTSPEAWPVSVGGSTTVHTNQTVTVNATLPHTTTITSQPPVATASVTQLATSTGDDVVYVYETVMYTLHTTKWDECTQYVTVY